MKEYCRTSYEQASYVRISEITDKNCYFRNFCPPYEYVKYVKIPTKAFLLNYHLFTFTTRLIIFVYCVFTLVLFIQYCITVLVIFLDVCICIYIGLCMYSVYIYTYIYTHNREYRTIGIMGPPTPPVSPLTRGSTVFLKKLVAAQLVNKRIVHTATHKL